MKEIIATLRNNKLIVLGAMGGAVAAPWATNLVSGWMPQVTGTPWGKFGVQLALAAGTLALASMPKLPTTALVAASAPFCAGAISHAAKNVLG